MQKEKRTFRLSAQCADYITSIAAARKITYTAAIEQIIDEHSRMSNAPANAAIADYIAEQVVDSLMKTLTRIRLAANNADRNSDVIIELLNGIYNYEGYISCVLCSEEKHDGVSKAQKFVSDRIKAYQTAMKAKESDKKAEQMNNGE